MAEKYSTEELCKVLASFTNNVSGLSLIPSEHIDIYWINTIMPSMLNLKIKYPKISNFTEYIVNTYFAGNFPTNLWNHYSTIGNRTNNHVEAYNLRLKKWLSAKSPNIYKAVEVLQREEVNSALRYQRANSEDSKVNKPPYRNHLDIKKEAQLNICKDLLRENSISLDIYIEKILNFYDFNRDSNRLQDSSSESDDLSTDESEGE